jgi:signal transduction histidine kinase
MTACQKKTNTILYKKKGSFFFNNPNFSNLKDSDKEKELDKIYREGLKQENDSVNRNLLFRVADKYYDLNNYDKYKKLAEKVLGMSIIGKDTIHIAKSLYYLGDYYDQKSKLDSAFSYYSQSEKLYKTLKDSLNIGKLTLHKAGILFDAGNFNESEIEAVNALMIIPKANGTRLIYECYNVIGISLKELNNYKKSLEYFDLALKQLDKLEKEKYSIEKVLKSRIACYNNIGMVYEKMKNHEDAIKFYIKGLQIVNMKQDYPKSYAVLLDNLAFSKMKSGDFKGVDKQLFESLRIRDSLGSEIGMISSKINIGEFYLLKKDTAKGLAYLKDGYLVSKKLKSSFYTIESLKLLMENDAKNKTYYTSEYLKIKDSIQHVERITRNKFARIAYEAEQIEEKNEILSERNTNIIFGFGITILFLGTFFIIYRLKSRNNELLFIKEQQEANEKIYQLMLYQQSEKEQARNEERNRIAMELHDGIVNSIFTTRFNLIQLDPNRRDKKEQLVKELEKTENEIRRVSHDLKQNLLFEDESLPQILANLVESQTNQHKTKFDISIDKYIDWSSVSSDNKIHIYRIIQEALQNSNKYANAERCYIMLLKTANKITIRIWDNGIGFNPEKMKQGIGLKNIKERTKALNGELKITSSRGKGTTIEIVF